MNQIYLIGDSTVTDNEPPFRGWGWALPRYVREGVTVHNYADSGRSSRSFLEEGLWAPVDAALQENAELEYDVAHAGDPETIESIARTKLGLVMPGEKIFYDVGN